MIKIEIPNISAKKQEYLNTVKPSVKERIELLIISSKHLRGDPIDLTVKDFAKYSKLSSKIIDKFISKNDRKGFKFIKKKYKETISNCLNSIIIYPILSRLNFDKIISFLQELLSDNGELLNKLLICDPHKLLSLRTKLLDKYKLNDNSSKYLLSLAFDYSNSDINNSIKKFFRKNNFVKFCPYCNINEVLHIETQGGKSATGHQLDHFFDKASYPLLACSFFNLIPSDSNCNGPTNKGSITFTDKFHLNPYIDGFRDRVVFEPVFLGNKIKEIQIKISALRGTDIRKQLLGSSEEINEDDIGNNFHKEGNVNVFKILSRYRGRVDLAEFVLNDILKAENGIPAIQNFLDLMTDLDKKDNYIKWYESTIKTPFHERDFNNRGYSKFNRDIHDFYYQLDINRRSEYINPT